MKKILLVSTLAWLAPLTAPAQDLGSLEQLRQAAERGNAEAQLEVGTLYEFGFNRPKNNVAALAWYQLAAERGSVLALKRRDQLKGRMTPEEIEEARRQSIDLAGKKTEATLPTPPP